MKTFISSLLLLFFFSHGIAQNIWFEVRGKKEGGVSKEKLVSPQTMTDIRPGYPSSMIEGYTSTEISVVTDGQSSKATGINEELTAAQKDLLQTAEIGSEITVNVGYIFQNPVTLFPEVRQMHFVMTVVPEVEAEFPGGHNELKLYLQENAIDKLNDNDSTEMKLTVISFTVSEAGEIINAQVSETSSIPRIDKLFLKAISKMPTWKPALNADGIKVEQEFEFIVGSGGC